MKIEDLEKRIILKNLAEQDYNLKKISNGVYRIKVCPICGSKDHFTIYSDSNSYSSFSNCCTGGSVYKYLQEVKRLSEDNAYKELNYLAGNPIETKNKKSVSNSITAKDIEKDTQIKNYTKTILELYNKQTDKDKEYFINRGLSKEIIEKYKLCVGDIKGYGGARAIIPVWKDGQVVFYNARALTQQQEQYRKYEKPTGAATFLNIDYLKTAAKGEVIIISEGEFDTLSLESIGYKSIAIGGTNNFDRLLKENNRQDLILLTAFDNDEAGSKASEKSNYKIEIPKKYKDINEWFIDDKIDFKTSLDLQVQTVRQQIKERLENELGAYKRNAVSFYIDNFKNNIKESIYNTEIPTGFKDLDNILDGGLYDGLYVIGAISSLGKTSWLLQICDQIAQQGQDVLYFSLEMSRYELMAKSISRLTFLNAEYKSEAKTTRGILNGKRSLEYSFSEKELIEKCIDIYQQYAEHLYISEGIGNIGVKEIEEIVQKHIKITGNKPVVVIDYLQILAPYNEKSTDKQNTDKAVLELKRLSRDYKIPVVAISSFNRDSYTTKISLAAFKESGGIEYSSDVLIGLQFPNQGEESCDIDKEKSKEVREIEVKILKNRNGSTGVSVNFEYHTLFNYFAETKKIESCIKKR